MHNCRFALICRIVPHPSHLPIGFNCGVWCGVWDLLCKMFSLSLLHLLNVLVSSSQTLLLSHTVVSFEADSCLPIWDTFDFSHEDIRLSLQVLLLAATSLHFAPNLGHLWWFGFSLCAHAPCSPERCCCAPNTGLYFHPSPAEQSVHKVAVTSVSPVCLPDFPLHLLALKSKKEDYANTPWQVFMYVFLWQLRRFLPYPSFFPNKSTNKLANLKRFIYTHKNNTSSTVFASHFWPTL